MESLGPDLVKVAAILAAMERVMSLSSVPRASGGRVARLGLGVSVVHLYPLDPLLNLLTSHSLPFCKQHLYGSYAFASRKVAFYSRYSFGESLLIQYCLQKKNQYYIERQSEGSIDFYSVRRLEALTISAEKECTNKECGARICSCS